MATRRRSAEDDAPEVGLVADPDVDEDEVPEGFSVGGVDGEDADDAEDEDEEGFDPDEDELEDDEAVEGLGDEAALEEEDLVDVAAVLAEGGAAVDPVAPRAPDDATVPVALDDDDEDEVEGIRAGIEFVCSRCRLVKRTSQLASKRGDPVCRSCA